MCDVEEQAVVNAIDVASIYDIPTMLHEQGLDAYIIDQLNLPAGEVEWDGWQDLLKTVHDPKYELTIALVGKYIDLPDAYLSVTEALKAGGFAHESKVVVKWVASDLCETPEGAAHELADVDGILVPGGFGVRGIEGKLGALRFARENKIPTLGICLGLQCMVIEYARDVVGLTGASSSEFDPDTEFPVIATMAEQVDLLARGDMGGTMRLGLYEARFEPGSIVEGLYGAPTASERHRHRYEVNNTYRQQIADAGLVFSGISPDRSLVEYIELPVDVHPFYVATQAHPELRSRPNRPHPLFRGLIGAALERQQASRLFEVADPGEPAVVDAVSAEPVAQPAQA
jgi:CTP synthase